MTKASQTFVLAAGGTGGHMFPADALRVELEKRGYRVVLITDSRGASFPGLFEGTETYLIESGTYARGNPLRLVGAGWRLITGTLRASRLISKIRPIGVVGFGGYPVVPAMTAARMKGIPYCLHEQNAVLGRANRMMAKKARAIALSFAKTEKIPVQKRPTAEVTGNPVRPAIISLGKKPFPVTGGDKPFNILVFGGSQGAKIFSEVVPVALGGLPAAMKKRLQVVQQCRKEDVSTVKEALKKAGIKGEVFDFIKNIPERLKETHLVIARGGATSLFEFSAAGRPSILVPLPGALDNHQTANARIMEHIGGGWVIAEREFSPGLLAEKIKALLDNPQVLKNAGNAALGLADPGAVEKLADLVENMAATGREKVFIPSRKKPKSLKNQILKRVPA